jgi:hypothetical protein
MRMDGTPFFILILVTSTLVLFESLGELKNGTYATLSYDEEHHIHSELFSKSTEIYFIEPLSTGSVYYFETADSDSVALVQTGEASIEITSSEIDGGVRVYDIKGQVFCMRRDENGNWKIWKWFEVN